MSQERARHHHAGKPTQVGDELGAQIAQADVRPPIDCCAEDEATAYRLQVLGAREGALKGTLLAGTIVALCNWRLVD